MLSLFPDIDKNAITGSFEEKLYSDRLDWLQMILPDGSGVVKEAWENTHDFLIEERELHKNKSLHEFHNVSKVLGIHLLNEEVRNIRYIKRLRDCLKLRIDSRESAAVFGPTSGAEIEAIHAARANPILVSDESGWGNLCEERLFDDRVPFDTIRTADVLTSGACFRYVIISPWVPDIESAVVTAFKAVGRYGFILSPSTIPLVGATALSLGMLRQDIFQDDLWVFFKTPDLYGE